jgi:cytochrome b pre-mRNA-processing protein 3
MILARWRARRANRILIDQIHGEIVAAARAPALFRDLGAPDDMDGRFEMTILHAALVLRRLGGLGPTGASISQELVDRVFEGFEDALRELAISDAGVARRIKSMGSAFQGRAKVYDEALAARDAPALVTALARNAFRAKTPSDAPRATALAAHVLALADAFDAIPIEAFTEGRFRYPVALVEAS